MRESDQFDRKSGVDSSRMRLSIASITFNEN
jgi:hypothetical protein